MAAIAHHQKAINQKKRWITDMGQQWNLGTVASRQNFDECITQMILAGKKAMVEIIPEGRTLSQNAMFHGLYRQVAKQKGDESPDEIESYCRYHFGLSILCAEDPAYADLLKSSIRPDLDYEMRLKITDRLEVTRGMSTKQGSEYIDRIIRHYSQQGLCLTHPSEVMR